jgi:hypothetical protein
MVSQGANGVVLLSSKKAKQGKAPLKLLQITFETAAFTTKYPK